MKINILSLVLVCLVFSFCATATGPSVEDIKINRKAVAQQTLTVEDSTYDLVWDACENTLVGLGCEFYLSDKNAGEIIVKLITKYDEIRLGDTKEALKPLESYVLSLLVSEADETILVQASVLVPNSWEMQRSIEMNKIKNEVNKVMRKLKERLKIK